MKQFEIGAIATGLMYQHGLIGQGWRMEFNRKKNTAGLCAYKRKRIVLSKFLTVGANEAIIRNTILHEIAHALTPGHSHDEIWRKKFIEIGGNGELRGNYKKYSYEGKCKNCNSKFNRNRIVGKLSCGKCSPGGYNAQFKIEWKKIN